MTYNGGRPSASALIASRRKPLRISTERLVAIEPLAGSDTCFALMRPRLPSLSVAEWTIANRESLERELQIRGALLLRGFDNTDAAGFEAFVRASSGPLLEYDNRSTPRSRVAGRVFTSTEYPADQVIPQHNEMSYADVWPRRIYFNCVIPAETGGQTPLANGARVLARIPADVRGRFERHGVLYVRNYGQRFDLPWQEAFQTDNAAVVEEYCREHRIEFEWLPEQRLRTRQVSQATAVHSETGQAVWFNQAHLFHVSALHDEIRIELERQFAPEDLPRNAYYGDGSSIDVETLAIIRAAYAAEELVFTWEVGDILIVDNLLMSHGRRSYSGPRRILVAMT
ncbi:TauD/TfdA family dioxygenase [Bradyrhizobium sp. CB1015]|uniref:TauD/TfdA family dioxygenase n=1 Tax=Bradyrhizobium sp. CB1015 TaxID=2976822 RepID=UPI0021A9D58C|nr:TauD/TfdA family dioxygenase [Bradyrhizobium sp. CB1015]UWU92929.1 TauD/TfdA family dioxygenase [Bradyrhizobium sp. CB1015]